MENIGNPTINYGAVIDSATNATEDLAEKRNKDIRI